MLSLLVIEVAESVELFARGCDALTIVTSKNFLTIVPSASLTFTHISYTAAFDGRTEIFSVLGEKGCFVTQFVSVVLANTQSSSLPMMRQLMKPKLIPITSLWV